VLFVIGSTLAVLKSEKSNSSPNVPLDLFSVLLFKLSGRGTGACEEKMSSKLFCGACVLSDCVFGNSINNEESPFLATAVGGFEGPLNERKESSAPVEVFKLFGDPGMVPIITELRFELEVTFEGVVFAVPLAAVVFAGALFVAALVSNVGVLEIVGVDLVPSGALGCVLVCCLELVGLLVFDEGPIPCIAFLPLAGAGVCVLFESAGILPMIVLPRFGCGASRWME